MKRILFLLLLVVLASVWSSADELPALMTRDEAKEIDSVVSTLLKAGFPDSEKAVVYKGEITVSATFDPTKGMPLPSFASHIQHTLNDSELMTYGYKFKGLHFKLADGTWLFSVSFRFKPGTNDEVNITEATEVNFAELTEAAMKEFPFNAEKDAAKWLAKVDPAQKARAVSTMNRLVPVLNKLEISPDSLAQSTVLLYRADWREAGAFSLIIADERSRLFWQLRPWTEPYHVFDPTGKYPNNDVEVAAWMKANSILTSELPQVALRRALFRWCRAQMWVENPEDTMLPLSVAAATTKAMIDPNDPQGNVAKIDSLLAGLQLPITPKDNAGLVIRLQSWEIRSRRPRMAVQKDNNGISTSFAVTPPAYTPEKSDIDALVALLANERPSRFHDFNGPRTVGDSAWCALAILLEEDPRKLAEYPTDNPWSAAERRVAATAVQRWWKMHRTEYVEK